MNAGDIEDSVTRFSCPERPTPTRPALLLYSPERPHETCHAFWSLQDLLRKKLIMLYTIAVILLVLWLLGVVSSYTINGFIHLLLVIAVIVILLRIINGRKPI